MAASFQNEAYAIVDLKPFGKYDCSRFVYQAARNAGIPGVKRTTSNRMSNGFDGWIGLTIRSMRKIEKGDLVFWTWAGSDRPRGHVGIVVVGRESGLFEAAHTSSKHKRPIVTRFRGVLLTDIDIFRRLK